MTDSQRVGLAKRLKEARFRYAAKRQESVSQAQMATVVGRELGRSLSQSSWSDYELAVAEPSLEVIKAVARISELSPAYIAFGAIDESVDPNISQREPGPAPVPPPKKSASGAQKGGRKRRAS
jgi:hypothetical protein